MERPTHTEDYVSAYILRGHPPSILMMLQIKIKVTDTAAHVLAGLTQKLTDRTELHRYMSQFCEVIPSRMLLERLPCPASKILR
jgi:hypothetical protein